MNRESTLDLLRNTRPVIAPSMLRCDFGRLQQEVDSFRSTSTSLLHWDVMDGHFVPNLSYGEMVFQGLDRTPDVLFEAHLMISDPGRYVDRYLDAGCESIVIHVEAAPEPEAILSRIRDRGALAGLAVNPGTGIDTIKPWMSLCDTVLIMSVEPGFGGQQFMPGVLSKVRRLRDWCGEDLLISIDGGIGESTIADAAGAGVDLFVVGSAIFNHEPSAYSSVVKTLSESARSTRGTL